MLSMPQKGKPLMSQSPASITTPAGWRFDNSYSRLPQSFHERVNPVAVREPKLVLFNEPLAKALGLNPAEFKGEAGARYFSGNEPPAGAEPLAQAYAGHQFGHFTMLGDGRANLLGEHITPEGQRYDIQLKGSGRTSFSRRGDGRAALGPMLREYIISEAMHALGIPTTRSLAVVTTGEPVYRDTVQPGAILTRVAASHLRVGTFAYAASWGTPEDLKALADYAIQRHYPEILDSEKSPENNLYLRFLQAVIQRQAELVAQWHGVGFIHGVMNTDNMTISGETIDYGPCAFMDAYDPATVFSSIDLQGRYAYGNQPRMAQWNLARFAEALLPLLHSSPDKAVTLATAAVNGFTEQFQTAWLVLMSAKLGLIATIEPADSSKASLASSAHSGNPGRTKAIRVLIDTLLELMQEYQADFTNTFRALTEQLPKLMVKSMPQAALQALPQPSESIFDLNEDLAKNERFKAWQDQWLSLLAQDSQPLHVALKLMQTHNPTVIPRNHKVEEALQAAVEATQWEPLEKLLEILKNPYAEAMEVSHFYTPADDTIPYQTFCGT